jgi:hypothetical protein
VIDRDRLAEVETQHISASELARLHSPESDTLPVLAGTRTKTSGAGSLGRGKATFPAL